MLKMLQFLWGGFFPSIFLWRCSNQLSSIFVKRERSERVSEKRTRPPINCSDNEYNVDRRSFSWIFIHRVVFFCFLYQNFSRNAEHLRFQVNAFCGYVQKIILFFCVCCADAVQWHRKSLPGAQFWTRNENESLSGNYMRTTLKYPSA